MAPNGSSQRSLLEHVMVLAGLSREQMHCVEMHGTGTKLGDPIECGALSEAVVTPMTPTVLMGGKANFGHLESAAGAAGMIKLVTALRQPPDVGNTHLRPTPKPRAARHP